MAKIQVEVNHIFHTSYLKNVTGICVKVNKIMTENVFSQVFHYPTVVKIFHTYRRRDGYEGVRLNIMVRSVC